MRELMEIELVVVVGGDDEPDYNAAGCGMIVAGATGLTTGIYGVAAGSVVGASTSMEVAICQTVTTYVGEAIGGNVADAVETFGNSLNEFYSGLEALAIASRWGNAGTY